MGNEFGAESCRGRLRFSLDRLRLLNDCFSSG